MGGGRQRERSPAHRGTVLFSGRLWDRKLGGLFRVPNYALHKTTMQRQAAGRTRSDKKLRRPWQGLLVCPRCSAWAPPEEYWQILEMMVSRGDRTPPVASLPEDTSLQPSPQVPSSPQWTRSLTPLQRPTPYKSQPPPAFRVIQRPLLPLLVHFVINILRIVVSTKN